MRIGIDIDDTITNSQELVTNYVHEYITKHLNRGIPSINRIATIERPYRVFEALEKEEIPEYRKHYFIKLIQNVMPKTFAVDTINELKNSGDEIYIITARRLRDDGLKVEEETRKWLDKHQIYYDKLIVDVGKKEDSVVENKIDIFIDDNIRHCMEVAKHNIPTLLVDAIHNVTFEEPKEIKRVYSWIQIKQEINHIKQAIDK